MKRLDKSFNNLIENKAQINSEKYKKFVRYKQNTFNSEYPVMSVLETGSKVSIFIIVIFKHIKINGNKYRVSKYYLQKGNQIP